MKKCLLFNVARLTFVSLSDLNHYSDNSWASTFISNSKVIQLLNC